MRHVTHPLNQRSRKMINSSGSETESRGEQSVESEYFYIKLRSNTTRSTVCRLNSQDMNVVFNGQ